MPTTRVKLDTYVIPRNHRVFKFFPGKGYKHFSAVSAESTIFLDVRGLDKLSPKSEDWANSQLLDVITQDRWLRQSGKSKKARTSKNDKATLTFLNGLIQEAKKGDLVVVPDFGWTSAVRIGELVDDPGRTRKVSLKESDGTHTYIGRRVRWLAEREKRLLDAELVNYLHSPAAFYSLPNNFYDDIYGLAYESYVAGECYVAAYYTSKNVFNSKDNFLLSVWFELLEVLDEAERGEANPESVRAKTIYQMVIKSKIAEADRGKLTISVNSPGTFSIREKVAAPLVGMALFALAVAGVPYELAMAANVSAELVGAADSECLGTIDESVRAYLKILGSDRWEQACEAAVQAQTEATLTTDAHLIADKKTDSHRR